MACSTATLYDNVHAAPLCGSGVGHPGSVTPMGTATGTGNSAGLTWWAMMPGTPYEDSPPPVAPTSALASIQQNSSVGSHQQASTPTSPGAPASASTAPPAPTASASSTSPSASSVASNSAAGPLHIPAKRLTATPVGSTYGEVTCVEPTGTPGGAGVIRHSHSSSAGSQGGWSYSPHHPQDTHYSSSTGAESLNHHQAYGGANPPTYYNLAADPSSTSGSSRDNRKSSSVGFWSPAAATSIAGSTSDYKSYNSAGGVATTTSSTGGSSSGAAGTTDPAVSCHQSFSQSWCSYTPYTTARHHHPVDSVGHHHAHSQASVSYLTPSAADDRGRMAAAMVAEAAFPHDSYNPIRNYGTAEPVSSSPYPAPGKHQLLINIISFIHSPCKTGFQTWKSGIIIGINCLMIVQLIPIICIQWSKQLIRSVLHGWSTPFNRSHSLG